MTTGCKSCDAIELPSCACNIEMDMEIWVKKYFNPFQRLFSFCIFEKTLGLDNFLTVVRMSHQDFLYYLSHNGWGIIPNDYKLFIDNLSESDYNSIVNGKIVYPFTFEKDG